MKNDKNIDKINNQLNNTTKQTHNPIKNKRKIENELLNEEITPKKPHIDLLDKLKNKNTQSNIMVSNDMVKFIENAIAEKTDLIPKPNETNLSNLKKNNDEIKNSEKSNEINISSIHEKAFQKIFELTERKNDEKKEKILENNNDQIDQKDKPTKRVLRNEKAIDKSEKKSNLAIEITSQPQTDISDLMSPGTENFQKHIMQLGNLFNRDNQLQLGKRSVKSSKSAVRPKQAFL